MSLITKRYPMQSSFYAVKYEAEEGVSSVTVPEGITDIGTRAFFRHAELTAVHLPESLQRISHYAFGSCTALKKIKLPHYLREIEDYAFNNSGLTELTLPPFLDKLGSAFMHCPFLRTADLSKGPDEIPNALLYGCSSLEIVDLPEKLVSIGQNAFSRTALTQICFPDTLKVIHSFAFEDCTSLTSVVLPDSLEELSDAAFLNCSIERIRLPENLRTIRYRAIDPNTIIDVAVGAETASFRVVQDRKTSHQWGKQETTLVEMLRHPRDSENTVLFQKLSYPDYRAAAAIWLSQKVPEEDFYPKYICNHTDSVLEHVFSLEDVNNLEWLLGTAIVPNDLIDEYLTKSIEDEKHNLTAILLHYKQQQSGYDGSSSGSLRL